MYTEILEINEDELTHVVGADSAPIVSNMTNDGDYPQIDNDPPG